MNVMPHTIKIQFFPLYFQYFTALSHHSRGVVTINNIQTKYLFLMIRGNVTAKNGLTLSFLIHTFHKPIYILML